jgi:hypothetical protein
MGEQLDRKRAGGQRLERDGQPGRVIRGGGAMHGGQEVGTVAQVLRQVALGAIMNRAFMATRASTITSPTSTVRSRSPSAVRLCTATAVGASRRSDGWSATSRFRSSGDREVLEERL